VGDRDDGAVVRREVLLEPEHRLGVEVVGRLVEEEQVGLLEQQLAQGDAVTSASGGGQRRASIACSSWESRSQASAASMASWSWPISAISASKSASGSAISALISL
jgi:hypothetical protein